jgi:hypothetical protein
MDGQVQSVDKFWTCPKCNKLQIGAVACNCGYAPSTKDE